MADAAQTPVCDDEAHGRGVVDRVEHALSVAEKVPDTVTLLTASRARSAAEASNRRYLRGASLGPLDGRPALVKDLFDLAGETTTAGSALLRRADPAAKDAAIVRRLCDSGAIVIGRTGMTEFAFSGLGINPHYGTPLLLDNKGYARVPGGSSSGAAAAVKAGIATISIGTDTSGSVRVPASFHGLVGFKASRQRYDVSGMMQLSPSMDSIGIIAESVGDAIQIDVALLSSEPSPVRPSFAPSFVVPDAIVMRDLNAGVKSAFKGALQRLKRQGFAVATRPVPEMDAMFALQQRLGSLVGTEAYRLHADKLAHDSADMDPRVAKRMLASAEVSDANYRALLRQRTILAAQAQLQLADNAIFVCPTVACVAPMLEPLLMSDEAYFEANSRVLRNTMVANFLEYCSVTLPCGVGEDGLAVGFMLMARNGDDLALLEVARLVESVVASPAATMVADGHGKVAR